MDTTQYLAEVLTVMLVDKYPDQVNEYETTTDATGDFLDVEIDEAKSAALWTLKALGALGYKLRRGNDAPTLFDTLSN